MKALAAFLRTTLIGGILVLLPIYLLLLVLLKMLSAAMQLLAPIMADIPATAHFPGLLAALVILGACFIAGLIVRTGPGKRAIDTLQRQLLEKIPGYRMLRNLVSRVSGDEDIQTFLPALVEIEEALVPAVIVEALPDGRVHRVNVPLRRLLQVYSRWGEGTGELVAAMQAAKGERQVSA